ncbi:hypothetical protein CalGV029 [Clostera anastomosis granulovirus A]|uniref:Uncharacterized protein n=1 Tax=Clostera anastomosis granulovirus A TaxID=1986289 RepID=U5KBK5_9BBAC|nr:hypothetical protein CalGV029 [Clostera anastomosis granulovirus Henan]AGQ20288.1 hypothetical protein CalGV029 [Clostera anastomosis granulovirus Henan]
MTWCRGSVCKMDAILAKKNRFITIAKQLEVQDHGKIRPHVNQMYKLIHMYCSSSKEVVLRSLYATLCECLNIVTETLLMRHQNHCLTRVTEDGE